VLVLGGFDCLEVPRFRGAGHFPHVWSVLLSFCSGSLMVFTTEDCEVGRPPGFGVVGRPGYWRVLLQESDEAVKRLRQPFVQF